MDKFGSHLLNANSTVQKLLGQFKEMKPSELENKISTQKARATKKGATPY